MTINYNNGKIYKIESHHGDNIYIGSTTKEYLSQRMTKYRSDYNRWKKEKKDYITSFKIFDEYGIDNCFITLLESYPCESRDALNSKKGYYIKTLNCVNKNILGRTNKQYYEDNKEYKKQYYEKNKDEILEKRKNIMKKIKMKLMKK